MRYIFSGDTSDIDKTNIFIFLCFDDFIVLNFNKEKEKRKKKEKKRNTSYKKEQIIFIFFEG